MKPCSTCAASEKEQPVPKKDHFLWLADLCATDPKANDRLELNSRVTRPRICPFLTLFTPPFSLFDQRGSAPCSEWLFPVESFLFHRFADFSQVCDETVEGSFSSHFFQRNSSRPFLSFDFSAFSRLLWNVPSTTKKLRPLFLIFCTVFIMHIILIR